jgi:hypothetical protein
VIRKLLALSCLVAALAPAAGAQTIDLDLAKAQDAYEKSNVELAKQIFTTIIASRQQVTAAQKVVAYKYLGAYWALQSITGARDSANSFFIAALDYDPFTTLDVAKFAADEQAAFGRAKSLLFKVGVRPLASKALDPTSAIPDSSRYTFTLVTTHDASLTVEIVSLTDPNRKEPLANIGVNNGQRDITWNGLINTQRADTGLYEFRVTATSRILAGARPVVESQKFRVDHFHAPLEDTLPSFRDVALGGVDTLKSRYSGGRPYTDGAKGAFIAALAFGLPRIVLSQRDNMSGWASHMGIGVSLGAIAGTGAAWYATSHRDDGRAAAENARRRNLRAQFNAGVMARNRARLDKTILIIRPLSAAGISG